MLKFHFSAENPLVVGTVHDAHSLAESKRDSTGSFCNLLEFRLDAFGPDESPALLAAIEAAAAPVLLTARAPHEGGLHDLSSNQRTDLILGSLGAAAAVDIEISSLAVMQRAVEAVNTAGLPLVASFHDFETTPPTKSIEAAIDAARNAGAAVAKIAVVPQGPADAARLLELLAGDFGIPLAVMGMGPLGVASRLLFAQCGSVLNYGHLGTPNAPGQWHAADIHYLLHTGYAPSRKRMSENP